MIKFSDKYIEPVVRKMWKECFDDSDQFVDFYFERKYKHENTLVYFEDDKPVASLQMLPYSMTFYGEEFDISYFSGLCTLPEYRKKGYMGKLIIHSFRILQERQIPLAILIPAEEWLYGFYRKYGFEKTFDSGKDVIPLQEITALYKENKQAAYKIFDSWFRNKNLCIQKAFEDFEAIMQDYVMDGKPDKSNLDGMSRIIDAKHLFSLYKERNKKDFGFQLIDDLLPINNIYIGNGNGLLLPDLDIKMLTRLILGYRTKESGIYKDYFPEQDPTINLMLE